jgi:hypothetical protein
VRGGCSKLLYWDTGCGFGAVDLRGLSRCSRLDQPDHSLHVVNEIGEADLRSRSSYADGADEQAHRAFLPRKDVLDRRMADLRAFA